MLPGFTDEPGHAFILLDFNWGFKVRGFGFRGSGALGFRVLGLGLGAEGLEFRLLGAWGLECPGPR